MTTTHRTIHSVASLLLAAGLAAPALAQQRAGSDGRALDASPQVGNRTNSQVGATPLDYRLRNSLVTGNAPAGQSLQIEQPYRAEYEFGGELGSDDQFDFLRDSLQSAPGRLNAATVGSINLGRGSAIYRSYTNAPATVTGGLTPERLAPLGGTYSYGQLQGSTLLTDVNQYRQLDESQLPGRTLQVTADPLLGLRQRVVPADFPIDRLTPQTPARQLDFDEIEDAAADPRANFRVEPPRYVPLLADPALAPLTDEEGALLQADAWRSSVGATTILGRQIQGRLGAERADRLDPVVEQRLQRLGQGWRTRAEALRQMPGASPYANLLTALENPQAARQQVEANRGESPRMSFELDEEQLQRAEQQRAQAVRRAYGLPAEEAPDTEEPGPRPRRFGEEEDADRGPALPSDSALGDLIEQLNYELPPLQSLAGDAQTRQAAQMKQAEEYLTQGQYFEAERLYRQVLERTAEPLARVGLVHAQLGAGLIRSAALNLRQLFEQHPEVIAARYSKDLLPPEERLNWVRGELEEMLPTNAGADAAIMLAYLGYQVNSRQLVRYGLATAEARAPRDPLIPVLRSIWLDPGRGQDAAGNAQQAPQRPEALQAPARQANPAPDDANSTSDPAPADVDNQP